MIKVGDNVAYVYNDSLWSTRERTECNYTGVVVAVRGGYWLDIKRTSAPLKGEVWHAGVQDVRLANPSPSSSPTDRAASPTAQANADGVEGSGGDGPRAGGPSPELDQEGGKA